MVVNTQNVKQDLSDTKNHCDYNAVYVNNLTAWLKANDVDVEQFKPTNQEP